jgi:hypothetical protein
MNLDHLMWKEDGWGYLPPTEEVFSALKDAIDISKAKSIFEIGFYAGHSTTYLANLAPEARIISCCPDHPRGRKYGTKLMDLFPDRVSVYCVPSPEVFMLTMTRKFDLCFLDGSHTYANALTDFMLCRELKIPYVLFDNTELKSVRTLLQHLEAYGSIKIVKEYTYESTFKGKEQTNGLTLVEIK